MRARRDDDGLESIIWILDNYYTLRNFTYPMAAATNPLQQSRNLAG
jgi:hypothetical protein